MVEILPLDIPLFALILTAYVYLGVGLALAFFGRIIWGRLMTLLGIVLGAAVGYSLSAPLFQDYVALAMAVLGATIGAMIFTWLVEVAVAGMAGILGLYVTYRTFLEILGPDQALIAGIVVLLVIFSVTFYFLDRVLGYAAALIGGVLTGVGLFLLTNDLQLSFAVAVGVAVVGAVVQELVLRPYEERIRKVLGQRQPRLVRR